MIAFGPVPSRRLGRSVGINNIPPKVCSYACVYCQVGQTLSMSIQRTAFYTPQEILADVSAKVEHARQHNEGIDYLTIVPDGEPTLDIHLGRTIAALKALGIPVAVISNASLIWRQDVRDDLSAADWVSLKVDSTIEPTWRNVDRPHGRLRLEAILQGMRDFKAIFHGTLVTETMLVAGLTDTDENLDGVARFLATLQPAIAYLSLPIRPPAQAGVHPADERSVIKAYQLLSRDVPRVEYLIGYEGNDFASTGNVEDDLLSIAAVHPMRQEAVTEFLHHAGADWSVVRTLLETGQLSEIEYGDYIFYSRRFART